MQRISVRLHPAFDLRYTAPLLAGLERHRSLNLSLDTSNVEASMLRLELDGRRILVDLSDHVNLFDETGLEWCDVYLKRSLLQSRAKILPFGLNYAGRGTASAFQAALLTRDLRRSIDLYRRPHWREYEYLPSDPVDAVVLLQTRLWEPNECPGDEEINASRIELVAVLKAALGDQFRGGLVDSPLARRLAPNLIATTPSRQRAYVRWQRTAKVGIYCRGLFGSYGFKLAEYLASSKCIVAEPLAGLLPSPLKNGEHLRTFNSPEECVERCLEMLGGGSAYKENAWRYYTQHVRLAGDAVRVILAQCERP